MSVVLLLVIPTLITAGLGYFILILWLAVSEMRRNRRAQWSIEEQSQPPFTVFFLVPCLDEELVITGNTPERPTLIRSSLASLKECWQRPLDW